MDTYQDEIDGIKGKTPLARNDIYTLKTEVLKCYTLRVNTKGVVKKNRSLEMCYAEPTECSKNPVMFYSAPPVFKEPMTCVKATRVRVSSTRGRCYQSVATTLRKC